MSLRDKRLIVLAWNREYKLRLVIADLWHFRMGSDMADNDVIIAGAGLAGLLCLQKLQQLKPEWTFTLLEREGWIGGRMRSTRESEGSWSCGLQAASAELLDFVLQTTSVDEESARQSLRPMKNVGVLIGQKLQTVDYGQLTQPEMARAIAGAAAVREWPVLDKLLQSQESGKLDLDQPFSQAWPGDRKSAALVPLEQISHLWGMPELGSSSLRPFLSQLHKARRGMWTGRWDHLFEDMLAALRSENRLHLETRAQIMAGRYEDKVWQLSTTKGNFSAKRLIVAQSPWEAVMWLNKDAWPARLLNIAGKTKPVSVVVLSEKTTATTVPDITMIVAEDVQAYCLDGQICYQAPLNYELTVQAPAVVKAVKRLKRAKKKLETACPELATESEGHLALLPVGWTHTIHPPEQKWFEKIDAAHVQKKHLAFAGDAIGSEGDGDQNLMRSVQDACAALSEGG